MARIETAKTHAGVRGFDVVVSINSTARGYEVSVDSFDLAKGTRPVHHVHTHADRAAALADYQEVVAGRSI